MILYHPRIFVKRQSVMPYWEKGGGFVQPKGTIFMAQNIRTGPSCKTMHNTRTFSPTDCVHNILALFTIDGEESMSGQTRGGRFTKMVFVFGVAEHLRLFCGVAQFQFDLACRTLTNRFHFHKIPFIIWCCTPRYDLQVSIDLDCFR